MSALKLLFQKAKAHPEILTLKDGRKLFYSQHGSPLGYPIIHFHGGASCRIEGILFDAIAKQNNFRIISYSRPGYDQSSLNPNLTFEATADDTYQLAKHLGIKQFGVTGWSAGGPNTMSCAYYLGHKYSCISFVGLMAPSPPLTPEIVKHMSSLQRFMINWGATFPNLAIGYPLKYMAKMITSKPQKFIEVFTKNMSEPDKKLIEENQDYIQVFTDLMSEGMMNGADGYIKETAITFSYDWGFNVQDIDKKICNYLFYGTHDNSLPIKGWEVLTESLPNCEAICWDDQGHMFPFNSSCVTIMYDKFAECIKQL